MKRLCVSLALLLVLGAAVAVAQPVPGKKFELGTAIALWSYSYENEDYSNSWTLLNIPVRFGWFLWKGLQLEPEVIFTIPIGEDKGDTAYFLSGHLVYNFKACPSSSRSSAAARGSATAFRSWAGSKAAAMPRPGPSTGWPG